MNNKDSLQSDLRNLKYDRLAVQMMHDDIARLTDDIAGHKESHNADINSLQEERDRLMEQLWDENNPANNDLELVVDAIDQELITVEQIIGF